MPESTLRFAGIELYFDDLDAAKEFYTVTLGLEPAEEQLGQFVKFDFGNVFLCLERKGSEPYPSRDKAVVFFETPAPGAWASAAAVVAAQPGWVVLHDPEGHNVLLLSAGRRGI